MLELPHQNYLHYLEFYLGNLKLTILDYSFAYNDINQFLVKL
jgi:hypothetical protein